MEPLLRHELRAAWRGRATRNGVLVLVVIGLVWSVFGAPNGGVPILLLILAGLVVMTVFVALGSAARSVRGEWRNGTASLWLTARYSASARLGAKLIAAVSRFWVMAAAAFLVATVLAILLVAALPHLPLVGGGAGAWSQIPGMRFLGSPHAILAFAAQYGLGDLAQLLLWGPPMAALGLASAALRVSTRALRRQINISVGIFWVLFWWLLTGFGKFLPPFLRIVSRGHGTVGIHFLPAGSLDVYLQVAPGVAMTAWLLVLAWIVGGAMFAVAAWWLRERACAW